MDQNLASKVNNTEIPISCVTNELTSLEKSALLTVLLQLRDSLALIPWVINISDLNQCEEAVYKRLISVCLATTRTLNELMKIIASENINNQLRQFKDKIFRTVSNSIVFEKQENVNTTAEILCPGNLKFLETNINLVNLQITEKELDEIRMLGDVSKYMMYACYENSYVRNWCNAKIEQLKMFCDQRIQKLEKEKDYYQSSIIRERVAFESQLDFLEENISQLEDIFKKLIEEQERTDEKLDSSQISVIISRDNVYKLYNSALQTLQDNMQWVINTRKTDAAVVLQRAWRKLLEDRFRKKALMKAAQLQKLKKVKKSQTTLTKLKIQHK